MAANTIDLLFWPDERGPLELVFGDSPGGAEAPEYTAALGAGARITGLGGPVQLGYDANVGRPTMGWASSRMQDARPAVSRADIGWQEATRVAPVQRVVTQQAKNLGPNIRSTAQASTPRQAARRVWGQQGRHAAAVRRMAFEQARKHHVSQRSREQQGVPVSTRARSPFEDVLRRFAGVRGGFEAGLPVLLAVPSGMSQGVLVLPVRRFGFQQARYPWPGRTPELPTPTPEWCYRPEKSIELLFQEDSRGPLDLLFYCGRGLPDPDPEPGLVIVPVRRVYMTINTVLLRRVAGSQTMPAIGFRMALDVDSYTWSWSATCAASAMSLLDPGSGDPVEMEVQINGVSYRLYAENVSRSRRFGETTVEVSGRGLAAELDAPYAQEMTFSSAVARSAVQLSAEALQINGVGIGWTQVWGLTDWLVPGGVWAHQGTHISAVNAIAQAAGGYVQPHPTSKVLRVLPRYPAAPWDWGDLTPDIELPADPVVVEGIRWVHKPEYNRVFVRGEGQGVLGQVTRSGTAGDVVAPMVVDPLITHVDAARQRGRQVLSDTGSQAEVSLSLPVLPETGLILPGKLVRYVEGGTPRLGLVRSTSVEWQRPKLRQTISLETHI